VEVTILPRPSQRVVLSRTQSLRMIWLSDISVEYAREDKLRVVNAGFHFPHDWCRGVTLRRCSEFLDLEIVMQSHVVGHIQWCRQSRMPLRPKSSCSIRCRACESGPRCARLCSLVMSVGALPPGKKLFIPVPRG
jgi:hypothetical protein